MMDLNEMNNGIYSKLKDALAHDLKTRDLLNETVRIQCKALSARDAIGNPLHDDYPIIKGREVIVESDFRGVKGQAFTDSFEERSYRAQDLLEMTMDSNEQRASFVASLNAIYRYLGLCENTVHCKDEEPVDCAEYLLTERFFPNKILLIGFQPRFCEVLSRDHELRIIDLDENNIGHVVNRHMIEPEENTERALDWCDMLFVTGSTLVNGTINRFLQQPKPVIFYGVTISAASKILGLNNYCACGH